MKAPAPPSISVVIPQWGRFLLTAHVIDRLRTFETQETEIIVVDDGSPDVAACPFADDPRVRFLRQRHRGVTSAWNCGARHACGKFLVFLNNDVQIEGPFLSNFVRPLDEQTIVMSGCCWRREHGVPRSVASAFPRELLEGWCFAVRRSDFEAIEGFDERFRLYFSDTDLQWRLLALRRSFRLACVPDLPIAHTGHLSTRTNPRRREHLVRDQRSFLQKWRSA